MDTFEIDNGIRDFLDTAGCGAELNGSALQALYREAMRICKDNMPGNFLQISGEAASSLMLAWIIRNNTLLPRNLFVRKNTFEKYAAYFEALGRGTWIKPVDELLHDEKHSRNWMGMLALIHFGEISPEWSVAGLLSLVSGQIPEGARIIINNTHGLDDNVRRQLAFFESAYSPLIVDHSLVLSWKNQFEVADDISPVLIAEFNQDDPVAIGLPTLMSTNERFQLYYAIRCMLPKSCFPVRFVEVGAFAGGTFYEVCMALQRQGLPYQGIAVEPYPGVTFKEVMHHFSGNAVHIAMKSHEAAPVLAGMFNAGKLPVFMLIDGDHSYEAVFRDIQDYYPMLAPGGIMMFHDYLPPLNEINREFILERQAGSEASVGDACRELLENKYGLETLGLPLLYPSNPAQTLASQAIIPGVCSTIRAYRKPDA